MKLPPNHVPGLGVVKATAYGGLGERLLKTMGWEQGQGLGRQGTGMKKAIEVKKKDDNAGIGKTECYDWSNKWWEASYAQVANQITEAVSNSSSCDSDASSDDEVGVPSTDAQQQQGVRNPDGTLSSATAAELRILRGMTKQASRLAAGRFSGRAGKLARIQAQEAKQAEALRAKLGLDPIPPRIASSDSCSTLAGSVIEAVQVAREGSGALCGKAEGSRGKKRSDKQGGEGASVGGEDVRKQRKKGRKKNKGEDEDREADEDGQRQGNDKDVVARQGKKKKRSEEGREDGEEGGQGKKKKRKRTKEEEEEEFQTAGTKKRKPDGTAAHTHHTASSSCLVEQAVPTAGSGWWGAGRFVTAGFLEGLEEPTGEAARKRQTFDEGTQEQVYNDVQGSKTAGKQGLGIRDLPRKVGGVRWQGRKTLFADEDSRPSKDGPNATLTAPQATVQAELQPAGNNPGTPAADTSAWKGKKRKSQLPAGNNCVTPATDTSARKGKKRKCQSLSPEERASSAEDSAETGPRAGMHEAGTNPWTAAAATSAHVCTAGGERSGLASVKWKKLALKVLQKASSEGISLKKLCAALKVSKPGKQAHMLALLGEGELKTTLLSKLAKSSQFVISGKRVHLAQPCQQ